MSLINDMLKNLEKRYEQTQRTFADHSFEAEEEESIFFRAFIVALIIVAIFILMFVGYHFYKHPWHFHEKNKAVNTAVSAPPAQTSNAAANSPAVIVANGFHLNDLPNQTEVEIDFNSPPTFVTNNNPANNGVSLTVDNASLDIGKVCKQLGKGANCISNNEIPLPINTTAIKSIHIDQNDGQALSLTFQLAGTGQLQDAHVTGNNLLITFSKKASANNASNSNNGNSIDVSTPPLPPPTDMDLNAGPTDSNQMLQPVTDRKINPTTPFDRINDLLFLKELDRAADMINALPDNEKNSMLGVMAQAKLQLAYGNNAKALAILQTQEFPQPSPDYYALYAATLEFNKKHSQAVAFYKKLVDYWPDNNTWWLGLGIAAQNDKEDELATTAYHHLIATNNLTPEVDNFVRGQLEELTIEDHSKMAY